MPRVDAANQLAAKDAKAVHFKPLVNAVLRKVAGEGAAILSGLDRERSVDAGLAVVALDGAV